MTNYKSMMITRASALKLIKALSEVLLEDDSEVLTLMDVDAPFILVDKVGEIGGHKRRDSNG